MRPELLEGPGAPTGGALPDAGNWFVTATRALVRRLFPPDADAELVEWVAAGMSAAPPEIAMDALRHAVGNEPGILAGLRELAASVVAMNPDARPTDTEALRRHGVRTMLMSGVGLFLMMEDPDRFNRLLGEVIEEFTGCPHHRRVTEPTSSRADSARVHTDT